MRRHFWSVLIAATSLWASASVPAANAGCAGWGCQAACEPRVPFAYPPVPPCALVYPPQPVYRVEQGPIHNVVVVPYEVPRVRLDYLPPRFFADCACWR